jgi:hypothetical protein
MGDARTRQSAFSGVSQAKTTRCRPRRTPVALRPERVAVRPRSLRVVLVLLGLFFPRPTHADEPSQPNATSRLLDVRLSLSPIAAERLNESRVRRLLEIELDDTGVLAPGAGGPFGDHIAQVWVDLPNPSQAVIEARIGDRPVGRRLVALSGFSWEVAARVVAIATSELVRALAQPVRPRRMPAPPPKPAEDAAALRTPALAWTTGLTGVAVTGLPVLLAGPSVDLGVDLFAVRQHVFGRWLAGGTDRAPLRWFEVGLALSKRAAFAKTWGVVVGAEAAFVSLGPEASATWSVHAGGRLAIERALSASVFGSLALLPGAMLRPAPLVVDGRTLSGAFLGAEFGLSIEPSAPKAVR